jgi:hypothetical protein
MGWRLSLVSKATRCPPALKTKGIVEQQAETGYLRSTDLWRDTVEILKTKVFGD